MPIHFMTLPSGHVFILYIINTCPLGRLRYWEDYATGKITLLAADNGSLYINWLQFS